MNQRDLSQLKRRLIPDKRNPTVIRGCYVSYDGQVISTFAQPVFHLPAEENEKYMSLFKRVLSGTAGQNLQEIEFTGMQAMEGEEHKILSGMRESGLTDEEAVTAFYERAINYIRAISPADAQSVTEQQAASNYLILLLHDGYDVPYINENGETDNEQASNVFSYILCCICPVKQTKPALSYFLSENEFHTRMADWVVSAPDLGFLFPAYEEGSANIYKAMFFTRDSADAHEAFVENVVEEEEALADLVGEEVVCEAEVVFGREYVEALADFLVGEVAVGEGCHLVEDGEGVAHASVGFFSYELESFVVGCVAFAVGYVAEVGDGVVEGHAVEVVDLTA